MTAKQQLSEFVETLTDAEAAAGLRVLETLRDDPAKDVASMTAEEITAFLDSVPGLWDRVQLSHQQYERGETISLNEL